MGIKNLVKQVLTEKENARYGRLLAKKKITYGAWAAGQERANDGGLWPVGHVEGIQGAYGAKDGIKNRPEEDSGYRILCASRGAFGADLQSCIRDYFAAHPEVMLFYGDEDVCDGAGEKGAVSYEKRRLPWFKPEWSPDLLESFFYFGSVTIIRTELFEKTEAWGGGAAPGEKSTDGGCRGNGQPFCLVEREGTEALLFYQAANLADYEKWMHLCVKLAVDQYGKENPVGHLRRILFHCDSPGEQEKFLHSTAFLEEGRKVLLREFRNLVNHSGYGAEDREAASGTKALDKERRPRVSVVIPSRDHPDILERCLKGCEVAADWEEPLSFEVVLVDNGSSGENKKRTEALIEKTDFQVTYLYQPQGFNFSRLCNLGAARAKGDILLFLNDDVELVSPGCMEYLAALAARPNTGAVGMKLYYPDSCRIQHAGITNLPMGPVHKLQFMEDGCSYYYGANRGRHNVLAVTAACLMVEKEKYLKAGGFAEELEVAFNDVDFCFRLHELGYRNVCANDIYAYHYESLSRGNDEAPEKQERLRQERSRLYHRHPGMENKDPYYSPCLNREGLDTGIRPAYLTAGNLVQKAGEASLISTETYRQDPCLMVRVEDCRDRVILGYGVILGDNNASYERTLLLGREPEGSGEIYAVRLSGQYRPDLEENMPDQENVALCGFWVEVKKGAVPEGKYRLGMAARNRVTGLKLVNWSSRCVHLEDIKQDEERESVRF